MSLFNAYWARDFKSFSQLLSDGLHPDLEKDNLHFTLLAHICRGYKEGDEAYVELLLRHGANPNHSRNNRDSETIISLLLTNANVGFRKNTLIKILELLLKNGANITYKIHNINYKKLPAKVWEMMPNDLLGNAIYRAMDNCEPEIVALLVKYGVDITNDNNSDKKTRLQFLKEDLEKGRCKGKEKVAQDIILLLEVGYDAYAKNQQRLTAIREAEEKQRQDELRRQCEEQQRIQAEEKRKLDEAQRQLEQLRLQAAQQKESAKQIQETPCIQEHNYNTGQLYALYRSKNLLAFKALLESGYNPDLELSAAGSVLTHLCGYHQSGDEEYITLLLEHGANPNKVSGGQPRCPLSAAIECGTLGCYKQYNVAIKVVEILLKNGANPDFPLAMHQHSSWGRVYMPLHRATIHCLALKEKNTILIETLLKYGSSLDAKDKAGRTSAEALEHEIRNNRMAPYNNPSRYVNYENIKSLLELGYEAHQKLITEQEAELKRQQEEMAQADDMLCGGEGNDELAQFFELHQPSSVTLDEIKQREEQRLTKIQESQHHLFSADSYKQCMKDAKMQAAIDAAVTTLTCIPSAIIETGGKLSECDRRGARTDRALYGLRRNECEHNESERQEKILKENRDSHLEKFFKNFMRICEMLGFAADGVLTSEQYNLVIEKMEEERAEKIKMLEALDLSGRRVEGYGSIGSHVKMSVMLSNFFDLDNNSFKSKIIETVANIKAEKIKRKIENELRKKFGSICINCGRSSAFCMGCGNRKSSSKRDSLLSRSGGGSSTGRFGFSNDDSSASSDSRRGRAAGGGAITTAYNNSRQRSSSAPPSTRSNGARCRPSSDFNFSVCLM